MKPVILGRDWGARANGTSPDQVSVLRFWLKRLKLFSLQPLKPRYHGTGGADTSKWEWAGMISVGEKYWIWLDVVGRSSQWCCFWYTLGFVLASGHEHPQRYDGFPCWPLHATGVTYNLMSGLWLNKNLPLNSRYFALCENEPVARVRFNCLQAHPAMKRKRSLLPWLVSSMSGHDSALWKTSSEGWYGGGIKILWKRVTGRSQNIFKSQWYPRWFVSLRIYNKSEWRVWTLFSSSNLEKPSQTQGQGCIEDFQ